MLLDQFTVSHRNDQRPSLLEISLGHLLPFPRDRDRIAKHHSGESNKVMRQIHIRFLIFLLATIFVSCGKGTASDNAAIATTASESTSAVHDNDSSAKPVEAVELKGASYWREDKPHTRKETVCVWVSDGDTIRTQEGETIRLLGVNTPEIAHPRFGKLTGEPFGEEAKKFLKK